MGYEMTSVQRCPVVMSLSHTEEESEWSLKFVGQKRWSVVEGRPLN